MDHLPEIEEILEAFYGPNPPKISGYKVIFADEHILSVEWRTELEHCACKFLRKEGLKILWSTCGKH